jgi:hypothetical protein
VSAQGVKAIETLGKMLDDNDVPDHHKLEAARLILHYAPPVIVDESKLQLKGFFHYLENTKIVPAGSYNADLIIHEFLEQVRPSEPERRSSTTRTTGAATAAPTSAEPELPIMTSWDPGITGPAPATWRTRASTRTTLPHR